MEFLVLRCKNGEYMFLWDEFFKQGEWSIDKTNIIRQSKQVNQVFNLILHQVLNIFCW